MKQERQQTDNHRPEAEWVRQLRDRLVDYEEPVADDLWTGIEAELAKRQAPKRQARIVPLWVRWTAAASLTAFLLSGGYLLWTAGNEPLAETKRESEALVAQKQETPKLLDSLDKERKGVSSQKYEIRRQQTETSIQEPADRSYPPTAEPQAAVSTPQPSDTPTSDTVRHAPQNINREDIIREFDRQIAQANQHQHAGISVNLYASNGFTNLANRNGVLMSPSALANYDYHSMTRGGNSPVWLYNYEERQKYYQPISVGLSLNIPISSRLSVATGIVYTRQRSEFTYVSNKYPFEKEQTLHYLGIPLSLRYRLWQWNGLGVYLTGGGEADYNIKIDVNAGGVHQQVGRDHMQFSVQGAAGVQYDFIPQLGLYVEPGTKHYFDNGSRIRNYFKDKPTNFNLQVGLRLNL